MVEGVSVLVYNINAPETRLFFQPLVLFIFFNNNNNNCFLFLHVEMRLVLVKAHVALTIGDGIVHFAQFFPDQGFDPLRHSYIVILYYSFYYLVSYEGHKFLSPWL